MILEESKLDILIKSITRDQNQNGNGPSHSNEESKTLFNMTLKYLKSINNISSF